MAELVEIAERDLALTLMAGCDSGGAWGIFSEFTRNAAVREKSEIFERLVQAITSTFVLNAMLAVVADTGRSGAIRSLVSRGATECSLTEAHKRFLRGAYGRTWGAAA